jgi:hypothetical protein
MTRQVADEDFTVGQVHLTAVGFEVDPLAHGRKEGNIANAWAKGNRMTALPLVAGERDL